MNFAPFPVGLPRAAGLWLVLWLAGMYGGGGLDHRLHGGTVACPGDSIWEVSSRMLPDCPRYDSIPAFHVRRVDGWNWSSASLDELLADPVVAGGGQVVVYVHGNWMPPCDARERALAVYRRMKAAANTGPVCFIMFSWPSERREGFARDVIGKKTRLDADAYYLARLIERLPGQQTLGLLGFSFGGPVICGALHLLNGGTLCGQPLVHFEGTHSPEITRVSLIAPAFDRSALTPNGHYSRALDRSESVVNLYNSMDPILKRFRFFDRDREPIAAGFAGILEARIDSPLNSDPKIEQFDCRCIGRTHAELSYLQCAFVVQAMHNVLGF